MSKVPGRYAATSEQWADAIRQEERERILDVVEDILTGAGTIDLQAGQYFMGEIIERIEGEQT
jgi:hypothetical protein